MPNSQQVLNVLRATRARVADPEAWWDGGDPHEGCGGGGLCALSAFAHFENGDERHAGIVRLAEAMGVEYGHRIPDFNDSHTHAEVLAAFDRAISTLEAEIMLTPNADTLLDVMAACDAAGAVVARYIVAQNPRMDAREIAAQASGEMFYAAQDTANSCALGVKVERA